MGNIVPVGTKGRDDVKVWLDEVSRRETLVCVAIAVDTKDGKVAGQVAEEIRNQEMLILLKVFYKLTETEESTRLIDDRKFAVISYRFVKRPNR